MDLTLPYFDGLHHILSEYKLELFYEIEQQFNIINYTTHADDIAIFQNMFPNATGADRGNLIESMYREHIDAVLGMQGIFLADPFTSKLSDIVTILVGCTKLATNHLSELELSTDADTESTDEVYFASILAAITGLSEYTIMEHIKTISETTLEYLRNNIPLPHIEINHSNLSKDRFMKALQVIDNVGITVNAIREINAFDYSPINLLLMTIDDLEKITDHQTLANEITLNVLGSHTLEPTLEVTALDILSRVLAVGADNFKVAALISRYFKLRILSEGDNE
jgi:hypothetical protein